MQRFRFLTVPVLLLALASVIPTAAPASAQQPVTIQISPQNDSGVSGTATLTPMGEQTQVVLALQNAPGPHPAHIHEGTCANLTAAPRFPLTPVNNGRSETTVNASLAQIQGALHAINVHKSPQEASVYVACGNIPQAALVAAAQPAQLPRAGQDAFAQYGLAALGALLALAGLGLRSRRHSA